MRLAQGVSKFNFWSFLYASFIVIGMLAGMNILQPYVLVLSIGQMSVMAASMTLVGQEAIPSERGAVIAMNGFCGAIGILLAFVVGGRLFDAFGPSAPFVMVGFVQVALFFLAIGIRILAPGIKRPDSG